MAYYATGKNETTFLVSKEIYKHEENIGRSLRRHGKEVKTQLEKVVTTGPRSGRVYSYRGRKYRASAPGEPPAKRSGMLAKSFRYTSRPMELLLYNNARSQNGAPYPLFLEEGTSKMSPRPYWTNTIEDLHMLLDRDLWSIQ